MSTSLVKTFITSVTILACCVFHPNKPFWIYIVAVGIFGFALWDVITEVKINNKRFGVCYYPMPDARGLLAKVFLVLGAVVLAGTLYTQYSDLPRRGQKLNSINESLEELEMSLPVDILAFAPRVSLDFVDLGVEYMELATDVAKALPVIKEQVEGLPEEEAKKIIDTFVEPYNNAVNDAGSKVLQCRNNHILLFVMFLVAEGLWAVSRKLYRGYAFSIVHDIIELKRRHNTEVANEVEQ